ncbi:MAG: beta-ketoacyl-[acyl-carrier-protein] synthase family protein [Pseudomonadales bacterium]|nr:beta-ketoacyl-[acyl-carrier-protein] synthase family protein [Pseudomonadales bacterium]HJN50394.1 beta-ketoacyl-[acyl-carrier-protein] synthase family protein [Pseudomonadales bacterium]
MSDIWANLRSGDQGGIRVREDLYLGGALQVGEVTLDLPDPGNKFVEYDCRNNRLLLAVCEQIGEEIGDLVKRVGRDRIAVVLGSSTSGVAQAEAAFGELATKGSMPEDFNYQQQEMGSASQFLSRYLGLGNIAVTVSTACSSSAKVFATARNLIQAGICDAALVGGVDSLCKLTVNGFASLESLSSGICNPMSCNRDGITIGEGAALFTVESQSVGIQLLGIGESNDAYHISSPEPQGRGAETSMREALQDAGLRPQDIDYINMHGTATPKNDQMESRAIARIFGTTLPCSSTKALTGHTLGASGATELGLCWLTLSSWNDRLELPPHVWDGVRDDGLPNLQLADSETGLSPASHHSTLSNSFAFGGNNISVILGRKPDGPSDE